MRVSLIADVPDNFETSDRDCCASARAIQQFPSIIFFRVEYLLGSKGMVYEFQIKYKFFCVNSGIRVASINRIYRSLLTF